ncbi:flagella synthesis protein FlgN [Parahaliea aestuarii]|uniref:Flagellar protein FlgN n=1 Tax=Parahaliea aestuarii TaxID=1852021 RepID=A0A5C9A1W4_9GAMM|nr:flagellar protein FlgN [Parahaliea aestuarii]TXS94768.1 flagellar protein FlgN [Parahaliea aestuarii]
MSLEPHLQAQRLQLEQLVALLHTEQSLLTQSQVDGAALDRVAVDKQQHLVSLDSFEARRRGAQTRLGYPAGREGAMAAANDAGCLPLWQNIDQLASAAKQLNQTNGDLIQLRLENNQRLLNALRESAGNSLYGPDGQSHRKRPRVDSRA